MPGQFPPVGWEERRKGGGRFKLPITIATLGVSPDGLEPIIHELADR
jgi:hypothetical protein